jgi:methyltransferase
MELSLPPFVALLALVAMQRLAEIARSRRHVAAAARHGRSIVPEPAFALMVAVHAGVLIGAPSEVALLHRPLHPAVTIVSVTILVAAQFGRRAVFRAMRASWSVRVVPPAHVATTGPFRLVRHPNYAIVCAELFALPLVHSAWITAIAATAANALVLAARIPVEEAVLSRDPRWREAFEHVPRLVPALRRRHARGANVDGTAPS